MNEETFPFQNASYDVRSILSSAYLFSSGSVQTLLIAALSSVSKIVAAVMERIKGKGGDSRKKVRRICMRRQLRACLRLCASDLRSPSF